MLKKVQNMNEHHVLGLSGGKDSAALAVFMRQHYPQLNIKYFFTDTGKELPEVYEFLANLEGFLGKRIESKNALVYPSAQTFTVQKLGSPLAGCRG